MLLHYNLIQNLVMKSEKKKSLIGIDERLLKKLLMEPSYRDKRFKSKGRSFGYDSQ